jgi:hypothetical protein
VNLALIDAIGPFFRSLDQRRSNWSKILFTLRVPWAWTP